MATKKSKAKIVKGFFESNWEDGTVITTPCTLNFKTGELTTKAIEVKSDLGSLESERFYTENDIFDEEVCSECHEYIMGAKMVPGIGHDLDEMECCKNPDCESNQEEA